MASLDARALVVAGVDGAPTGWVVVRQIAGRPLQVDVIRSFAAVLERCEDAVCLGVDMPIGLPALAMPKGRPADALARARLGARRSSLFSAPSRAALEAFRQGLSFSEVSRLNGTVGLTLQAFNLLRKIDEVDREMTPERQRRVREVHPESAFAMAAGHPLDHSKHTAKGLAERRRLLDSLGLELPRGVPLKTDDVLDAAIACWSAGRLARDEALVLGGELDERGLRMEICF
jgi:predicted RNase H-like nuclease